MNEKILIEVYGVKDGIIECNCCNGDCKCNCGSSSSVSKTSEMYDNLICYFEKSELKDKVTIKFIDILNDEYNNYEYVSDMLERGFEPPFIAINNEMELYGSISNELIYEYVEDAIGIENKQLQ